MKTDEFLREIERHRAQYEGLFPMYRNMTAIEDLLRWTLDFADVRNTVEKVSQATLSANVEAGVDTGMLPWLLKLKAGFSASTKHDKTFKNVVQEDMQLSALALAETVLRRKGKLTTDPSIPILPEYFKFRDEFTAFAPGQEGGVLELLGRDAGQTVVDRWKLHASMFENSPQFLYATAAPRPIASILLLPLNAEKNIWGSTNAMTAPFQHRIYFGRFGAEEGGVRFVSTMFYVADGDIAPLA